MESHEARLLDEAGGRARTQRADDSTPGMHRTAKGAVYARGRATPPTSLTLTLNEIRRGHQGHE